MSPLSLSLSLSLSLKKKKNPKFVSHDESHLAQLIDTFFVFLTETFANPLLLNFQIIKNKKLSTMALIEN